MSIRVKSVVIRRNLDCGVPTSTFGLKRAQASQKRHDLSSYTDVAADATMLLVAPASAALREHAELLNYLAWAIRTTVDEGESVLSDWEYDFITSVVRRVGTGRRPLTAPQERVVRSIITKVTGGKTYWVDFERRDKDADEIKL